MTRDEVMALLATMGNDATVYTMQDGTIDVTIEDFEGFDDDWDEIYRDYDVDTVDHVYDTLEAAAVLVTGSLYTTFDMGGFNVAWGYASYDI